MKPKILISLCLLLTTHAWGEELFLKGKGVTIQKLEELRVNLKCVEDSKECLELLKKAPIQKEEKGMEGTVGHPASKFCGAKGGSSLILEDKKHNQYDYCMFEEKYYVDSWDLYRKFKK